MAKTNPGFNDLKLAAEVRSLTLNEIKKVLLQDKMDDFKKQVILRLAANTLPRLNEHTGADGASLELKFDSHFNAPNTPQDTATNS